MSDTLQVELMWYLGDVATAGGLLAFSPLAALCDLLPGVLPGRLGGRLPHPPPPLPYTGPTWKATPLGDCVLSRCRPPPPLTTVTLQFSGEMGCLVHMGPLSPNPDAATERSSGPSWSSSLPSTSDRMTDRRRKSSLLFSRSALSRFYKQNTVCYCMYQYSEIIIKQLPYATTENNLMRTNCSLSAARRSLSTSTRPWFSLRSSLPSRNIFFSSPIITVAA